MAGSRKDNNGRPLKMGECQRKSDQRYVYTYQDVYGKRRYAYAVTLNELREKERQILKLTIENVDAYTQGKMTLNDIYDRYIKLKANEVCRTTIYGYKVGYDRYIRDYLGQRPIGKLRHSDFVDHYAVVAKTCALSYAYIKCIHGPIIGALDMAVKDDVIKKNPASLVLKDVRKLCKDANEAAVPLTKEQQASFFEYLSLDPRYNHLMPIFTVLMGTGMRISEALGLRWEDIDFEKNIIDVNHGIRYDHHGPNKEFFITNTKTANGIRKIPMVKEVRDVFEKLYKEQSEQGFCKIIVENMTNFIFTSDTGELYTQQMLNQRLKTIVKYHNQLETLRSARDNDIAVILPKMTCYTFRHTFATRLCAAETNLKVIQGIMGHGNIKTTMNIYASFSRDKEIEAMDRMSLNHEIFGSPEENEDAEVSK